MKISHGTFRRTAPILVSVGILLSFCIACANLPMLYIHRRLEKLTSSLEEYPLPANSRVITVESNIRENTGNGDYCLYLVQQTISTSLNKDEIQSYYADAAIPGVNEGGYAVIIVADFPNNQFSNDESTFTIEVHDMTERYFDFGCR